MSESVKPDEMLHRLIDPPAGRIERIIAKTADLSSPILVKEIRQALKSRSFLWTYLLVLLACVLWSFMGMYAGILGSQINMGGMMLVGYLCILGFPLGVVVPLTAYRSLCREFEEDTLHLVSITTMSPRQLVHGKLISALAQMLVYLSAVAPCVAFTWLLRGVDVMTISLALLLAVVGSASLSALALFIAAISRSSAIRMVGQVILIIGLVALFFGWCGFRGEMESGTMGAPQLVTLMHFMLIVIFGSTGWLLLEAASSAVSFPAENRSTNVRIALLIHSAMVVIVLTMTLGMELGPRRWQDLLAENAGTIAAVGSILMTIYWTVAGSLMMGEPSELSARVRRSLPGDFLGRTFRSLLMPGSGRGFLLAVSCMLSMLLAGLTLATWYGNKGLSVQFDSLVGAARSGEPDFGWAIFFLVYLLFYLSAAFLLLRMVRHKWRLNPLLGIGSLVFAVGLICASSWIIHLLYHTVTGSRDLDEFTLFLIPNVFSAAVEFFDRGNVADYYELFVLFGIFAVAVIFVAILVASRELLDLPIAIPQRVLDERARALRQHSPRGESVEDIFASRAATVTNELPPGDSRVS